MAHIHKISGSTQYLLNGVKPIQGKKLNTLSELTHFHDNYQAILAATEDRIATEQDEIILHLSANEVTLRQKLQQEREKCTVEVDKEIEDLRNEIERSRSFFGRTGLKIRHWFAVFQRTQKIQASLTDITRELEKIQQLKRKQIDYKSFIVWHECRDMHDSYRFLKENYPFLIGAHGEEAVISTLSHLSDDYHVVNDANLHFHRAIHWRAGDEYIKNCQIDHIVIGPTGIFLLETKNWKASDVAGKSNEIVTQVHRSNFALWYYLKDNFRQGEMPKIRNVLVSIHGVPFNKRSYGYIDVISPDHIIAYIMQQKTSLSADSVNKIVNLLI